MRDIKVNDIVYYRSPYPEGSVLKVFVKKLNHLVLKNNKNKDISGFSFLVEIIEVIIKGKDHQTQGNNDNSFIVVEEYLHHDLDEAINIFNKTKEKKLKLIKERLKKHNEILKFLDNIPNKNKFSTAETDIIGIRGQKIKKLKDLNKTYYSFFDWEVSRGLEHQSVLEGETPLIFEVEIVEGKLDNKNNELFYSVFPIKGFGKDKNEISTCFYSSFDVNKLEHFHNTYDSALQCFKNRIIELIKKLEKEIKCFT